MPRKAGVYNRFYVGMPATQTGIEDAQRKQGLTAIGYYAALHHHYSDTGAEQAPAEAMGGAAPHAQQEEGSIGVLLLGSVESGQLVVGDLVVAGGDVHDQEASVVVALDRGTYVALVDLTPEPGCILFGVLGAILHNHHSTRAELEKVPEADYSLRSTYSRYLVGSGALVS